MKTLQISKKTAAWTALAILFFLFFAVRAWKGNHNDFVAYFNAGTRAAHGESPYLLEETPFRYLPLTAFFFSPLTLFPMQIARVVFFSANFAALVAIYMQIHRRVGSTALFLILALLFRFHNHDFSNAQVNPILLVLFFAWWKFRTKELPLATLAFAIFASFKILPFAFCLPLLLLRRWKEVQWIILWSIVLNFVPVFFYDHGPYIFKDWYDQAKLIAYPAVLLSNIQSIQSALWWWLDGKMDARIFAAVMHVLQLGLLIATVVLAPKSDGSTESTERRENWVIASSLAVTVLIAPMAWKHNYLQFLPLVFLWFREDPHITERRTRVLYATAFLGMVAIPSLVATWNRGFSDRMYLMVWTGVAVILLGLRYSRSRSAA